MFSGESSHLKQNYSSNFVYNNVGQIIGIILFSIICFKRGTSNKMVFYFILLLNLGLY